MHTTTVSHNANTAMIHRGSKPAHDYMGFNSIKSSFKSDPNSGNKLINNSISSDCLNAQRIHRPKKIKGTNEKNSGFQVTTGAGEQDLKKT